MKKVLASVVAVSIAVLCGCQSTSAPRQAKTQLPPHLVSTNITSPANITPYTNVQGPVSSYKPVFSVDTTKRISGNGEGRSEQIAKRAAITDAILKAKADDMFVTNLVTNVWSNGIYKCEATGFAVNITDVEEIPTAYYEQLPDGKIVKSEKLEHKLTYVHNHEKNLKVIYDKEGKVVDREYKEIPAHWEYVPVMDPAPKKR